MLGFSTNELLNGIGLFLLMIFALGIAFTLAVIYGIPIVWTFIKPWLHAVTG